MKIVITDLMDGRCVMTGKEGEVIVIQTDEEPGPAHVCFKALQQLIRFHARREQSDQRLSCPGPIASVDGSARNLLKNSES